MRKRIRMISVICAMLVMVFALTVPVSVRSSSFRPRYVMQKNYKRSNRRKDFSSAQEYANYRCITAGSIRAGRLYRGVSPYKYEDKRGQCADRLMKKDGIRTVINFERESIEDGIRKKQSPYYYRLWKQNRVKRLHATFRLSDWSFRRKIAAGLKCMSRKKGPYYVHCVLGRDRTGYYCALLECFMGASYREVVDDCMTTYTNFYGHLSKSRYNRIKRQTIIPILQDITGARDPKKVNLKKRAEKYMTRIGVTKKQQKKLRKHLSQ